MNFFTTPDGKEVINFDNIAYYSFSEEKDGGYITSTDPDSDKFSSKATGSYYYTGAENENDPKGTLYLEDGPEFKSYVLKRDLKKKKF